MPTYQGLDDLDNVGQSVLENHHFQVYQGGLPPLSAPEGRKLKAVSGGAVEISWNEVPNAAAYQIFRKTPRR